MIVIILTALCVWFLANALFMVAVHKAPLGYEDKGGFHLGGDTE